jgi:hypothetical protein
MSPCPAALPRDDSMVIDFPRKSKRHIFGGMAIYMKGTAFAHPVESFEKRINFL